MNNKHFYVQHGLTVGNLSIDAATGDITTTGNINGANFTGFNLGFTSSKETIDVPAGQTLLTFDTLNLHDAYLIFVYSEGYAGTTPIPNYTIVDSTTLVLQDPLPYDTSITVVVEQLGNFIGELPEIDGNLNYIVNKDNIVINGNLIPLNDNLLSLGTLSNAWQTLYISGNTIHVGNSQIVADNGKIFVDGVELSGAVKSVNGQIGDVVLAPIDIGGADAIHDHVTDDILDYTEKTVALLANTLVQGNDISIVQDAETGKITITSLSNGDVESVNGQIGVVELSTDEIPEGTANLYFTTERAISAVTPTLANVAVTGSYNDLVDLPDLSVLDEIRKYDDLTLFPETGEFDKIYLALDTGYMYRWNGTEYVQLSDQTAIWGYVSGNIELQTDLWSILESKQNALESNVSIKTLNGIDLLGSGDISLGVIQLTETQVLTAGATSLTLSNIALTSSKPLIFIDGYAGSYYFTDFSVTSNTTIEFNNPLIDSGKVTVIEQQLGIVNESTIDAFAAHEMQGDPHPQYVKYNEIDPIVESKTLQYTVVEVTGAIDQVFTYPTDTTFANFSYSAYALKEDPTPSPPYSLVIENFDEQNLDNYNCTAGIIYNSFTGGMETRSTDPQLALPKILTPLTGYANISDVTVVATTTNNGIVRTAVSRDLVNWYVWNGNAWVSLGALNADSSGANTVRIYGMSPSVINNLTFTEWDLFYERNPPDNIAIAYAFDTSDIVVDVARINNVTVDVNHEFAWLMQTPTDVEVRWYPNMVTFKTKTSGKYKLAYQTR